MNHLAHVVCFGCLGLLCLAASASAGGTDIDGAELADRLCARCHDTRGPGPSPVAEAPPFQTVATRWPPDFLAEALAEGITVRHAEDTIMPPIELHPDEISALISYLEDLTAPVVD